MRTGNQIARYDKLDFSQAPALGDARPKREQYFCELDLPGRTIYAKVYQIQVGRVSVVFDGHGSGIERREDRVLTARLVWRRP